MTGNKFVFIANFPPLWSCCVYDKWLACDRTVGQAEEGGADSTTHSRGLYA